MKSPKLRIFLIAPLFLFSCFSDAAPVDLSGLKSQEGRTKKMIPYRGGVLVRVVLPGVPGVMYAEYGRQALAEIKVEGVDYFTDVERGEDGATLFLGLTKAPHSYVLVEENKHGKRRQIPVPKGFEAVFLASKSAQPWADAPELWRKMRARLVPSSHRIAVICGDVLWWYDKKWRSRKLPELGPFRNAQHIHWVERTHLMVGDTFYVGLDMGQWGGILAKIDLQQEDLTWAYLSGQLDGEGIPHEQPVTAIVKSDSGLWVSTGLAHMDVFSKGLYHCDTQGKWRSLIDGEDRGGIEFREYAMMEDIAIASDGSVLILVGGAGVYRWSKGKLVSEIECNFYALDFDKDVDGDVFSQTNGGGMPERIQISVGGDIYVSTHGLGVLAFRKEQAQWKGMQLGLKKPEEK